ncbi:hypothetical protein [endosymbiont of unidentified scaly snail isolate Monju]|uniref:hypothetical protein n=1 Tax=endosymbiont of unidentified scaly snail isolate Monju TaxID=1248727 RepID=UPI0005BD44F1|nr:hypothetical protein [endosymbiont of unidentified scaly snail isolate Monju]
MKKLVIATLLTLSSAGAMALDQVLDNNEYYGSPLADHAPGSRSTSLGPNHDHGDDTVKEFVRHGHDLPVKPDNHPYAQNMPMHDHGDDTIKNFVPHSHS